MCDRLMNHYLTTIIIASCGILGKINKQNVFVQVVNKSHKKNIKNFFFKVFLNWKMKLKNQISIFVSFQNCLLHREMMALCRIFLSNWEEATGIKKCIKFFQYYLNFKIFNPTLRAIPLIYLFWERSLPEDRVLFRKPFVQWSRINIQIAQSIPLTVSVKLDGGLFNFIND